MAVTFETILDKYFLKNQELYEKFWGSFVKVIKEMINYVNFMKI